jgi:hypothetical protein
MFYGFQDVEVWRLTPASGNWGDPTYTYHHTENDVTVQPFSSNQMMRNNQLFANVIGVMTTEVDADIQNGDELVYLKDTSYGRVSVVEPWDSDIMPHLEVYTTYSQWDRNDV